MLLLKPRLTLCFLPASMFSRLASHVVATRVLFPRLVARASTQASIKVSPADSAVLERLVLQQRQPRAKAYPR